MLNYHITIGAMKTIANSGYRGHLQSLGITEADYKKFVGSGQWIAADRGRMSQVLSALLYGATDALGMPRFELPAEYVAAGIAVWVSGVNMSLACEWAPNSGEAAQLARSGFFEKPTTKQLFALVQMALAEKDASEFRALFEKNVGIAIDKTKE